MSGCCGCCFESCEKQARDNRIAVTWVLALLATCGTIGMIAGGGTLGTAERSTRLDVIQRFQSFYESTEQSDMKEAHITAPAGFILQNQEFKWTAIEKSGVSKAMSFTEFFWEGTIQTPTSGSAVSTSLSFNNNVRGSVKSVVKTPQIPLKDGSLFLTEMCIVVKRETRDGEYVLDKDYDSCYYPFKETSNKYESVEPAFITVRVISFGDPALPIDKYSEGTLSVKDKDVILAPSWTVLALIAGAALFVMATPLAGCFVCYCWNEPPAVMKHIAFSIFCPCRVSHELPVRDPLQTGCVAPAVERSEVALML